MFGAFTRNMSGIVAFANGIVLRKEIFEGFIHHGFLHQLFALWQSGAVNIGVKTFFPVKQKAIRAEDEKGTFVAEICPGTTAKSVLVSHLSTHLFVFSFRGGTNDPAGSISSL